MPITKAANNALTVYFILNKAIGYICNSKIIGFFIDENEDEGQVNDKPVYEEVQRTAPVNIERPKGDQPRRRRRKKRIPSSSFSDEFHG